jgi:hypothetical protein
MIWKVDLAFAFFYLFLIICYLFLSWLAQADGFRHRFKILLVKYRSKFVFKPIDNSIPKYDEDYQSYNEYAKNKPTEPPVLLHVIGDNNTNDKNNRQSQDDSPKTISLLIWHSFAAFCYPCIRVYRVLSRCQPKGNDTMSRGCLPRRAQRVEKCKMKRYRFLS